MARWGAVWLLSLGVGSTACDSRLEPSTRSIDSAVPAPASKPPEYWAARLRSDSAPVRLEALGQLGSYGSRASNYAPAISQFLPDPDEKTGFTAAWALAHTGMIAYPLLIRHLEDTRPVVRERAAYSLGEIGPQAADAAQRLQALETGDPDVRVRNMAEWAGKEVTQRSMIPDRSITLMQGAHGSRQERFEATRRLGVAAGSNAVAISELIKLLGDSLPGVRSRAIEALAQAGPAALPALSAALSHRNRAIRSGAVLALSRMQRSF